MEGGRLKREPIIFLLTRFDLHFRALAYLVTDALILALNPNLMLSFSIFGLHFEHEFDYAVTYTKINL